MTIQDICASFEIGGKYVTCKELSTGIINCTYHVQYIRDGEEKNYIVQRINKAVFKNPAKLMENIINVTDYVRENIKKKNLSTVKRINFFNKILGNLFERTGCNEISYK